MPEAVHHLPPCQTAPCVRQVTFVADLVPDDRLLSVEAAYQAGGDLLAHAMVVALELYVVDPGCAMVVEYGGRTVPIVHLVRC